MIFSEPFRITALQSQVLKAFIILDSHTPGSTAVENSVRVKVKVPHEPCFFSSLPSQFCYFPCSSALHMLPLNNSFPPRTSAGMALPMAGPRATALTLYCRSPFSATCWALSLFQHHQLHPSCCSETSKSFCDHRAL